MGIKGTMGGDGTLFVGEDKQFRLELLAAGVPVDMSGWGVSLVVHRRNGATLITKAATISGSFNATRAVNTQRAVVTLTDTELTIPAGSHLQSWKRTDDGSEAILYYGPFVIEATTQT